MYHVSSEKTLELHYPSTQGGKLQQNKQVAKRLQEVLEIAADEIIATSCDLNRKQTNKVNLD